MNSPRVLVNGFGIIAVPSVRVAQGKVIASSTLVPIQGVANPVSGSFVLSPTLIRAASPEIGPHLRINKAQMPCESAPEYEAFIPMECWQNCHIRIDRFSLGRFFDRILTPIQQDNADRACLIRAVGGKF